MVRFRLQSTPARHFQTKASRPSLPASAKHQAHEAADVGSVVGSPKAGNSKAPGQSPVGRELGLLRTP